MNALRVILFLGAYAGAVFTLFTRVLWPTGDRLTAPAFVSVGMLVLADQVILLNAVTELAVRYVPAEWFLNLPVP